MAYTQQKTSYMANALVAYAHKWISTLPGFEQDFIPMDKIPAAAGALAKFVLDTSDQYDLAHPTPAPQAPLGIVIKNGRGHRRRK